MHQDEHELFVRSEDQGGFKSKLGDVGGRGIVAPGGPTIARVVIQGVLDQPVAGASVYRFGFHIRDGALDRDLPHLGSAGQVCLEFDVCQNKLSGAASGKLSIGVRGVGEYFQFDAGDP